MNPHKQRQDRIEGLRKHIDHQKAQQAALRLAAETIGNMPVDDCDIRVEMIALSNELHDRALLIEDNVTDALERITVLAASLRAGTGR